MFRLTDPCRFRDRETIMDAGAKLNARDLAALERNHEALLRLCLILEEIVSSLPDEVDGAACTAASETVADLLEATHRLEEHVLFPDFRSNAGSHFARRMIEQLKAEHRCDLMASRDVVTVLKALAGNGPVPAGAGHLLAGFLEALRRHVHSEKLIIEALLVAEADGREVLA